MCAEMISAKDAEVSLINDAMIMPKGIEHAKSFVRGEKFCTSNVSLPLSIEKQFNFQNRKLRVRIG